MKMSSTIIIRKLALQINFILVLLLICNSFNLLADVQWASKVISYSSQYSNKKYSASQSLGPPQVMTNYGTTPCSWAPKEEGSIDGEFLHLEFKNPQKIIQIFIHETNAPGAIYKIIAYDDKLREHIIYTKEKLVFIYDNSRFLRIILDDLTSYKVKQLKLFLNTKKVIGYNQIEAVGISESIKNYKTTINEDKSVKNDSTFSSFQKTKLSSNINSNASELLPIVSSNSKKLFFTRNFHSGNIGEEKKQDIWYSGIDKYGNIGIPHNIGYPINNEDNNFAFSVSVDGKTILLGNKYNDDGSTEGGVSISNFDGNNWTKPKELFINNYSNLSKYSTFFLANSGKTLLMSLDNNDSYGGSDLYVSFLNKDDTWSTPKNIGNINTASDEYSPFLAADDKTLYFSSGGYPGYGKNDIFYSKRLDDSWQNWSTPINIGSQINTIGNDSYYSLTASNEYAYFVSSVDKVSYEDIYRLKLPVEMHAEDVMLVSGKIINKKEKKPMKAKIIYENLEDGKELGITYSNEKTGEYSITLPKGTKYGVRAEVDGYVAINENFDTDSLNSFEQVQKDINLIPLEKGQKFLLNNIFFNFAEFTLLKNSFAELNRVVSLLNNNKFLKIQINGHSDNNGTTERNMMFSLKRAKSVRDYLVSKGIDETRIIAKGFGEKMPLVSNSTFEGRNKNRRVEFEIIN